MRITITTFLLFVTMGCASNPDRNLPTGVLTIALVGDLVLVGRAYPLGNGGSFSLQAIDGHSLECTGRFKYHYLPLGKARFTCSNAQKGNIKIETEGGLKGSGKGRSELGNIQIVFGYSLSQANRKLDFPDNQILVEGKYGLTLQTAQ